MTEEIEDMFAELMAFEQRLMVLSLRGDCGSDITYEEFMDAHKKMKYRWMFKKLPEKIQEKVKKLRYENYGIK